MTTTIDPRLLAQFSCATSATNPVRAYVRLREGHGSVESRAADLIGRVSRATRVPAEHYYNDLLEKVLVSAPPSFYEALAREPDVEAVEAPPDLGSSAMIEPREPRAATPEEIDRPVGRRRGKPSR